MRFKSQLPVHWDSLLELKNTEHKHVHCLKLFKEWFTEYGSETAPKYYLVKNTVSSVVYGLYTQHVYSTLRLVPKPYLKHWGNSQLICLKSGQSVKQFISKYNRWQAFMGSGICRGIQPVWTQVSNSRSHLSASRAVLAFGNSRQVVTSLHTTRIICCMQQVYGPYLLLYFIISVLLQLPFKSYLILVIYRIIYSRSYPCINCLHIFFKIWFK